MNIYDFDGTIYDGDSSIDFLKYSLKKSKKVILTIPKTILFFFLYLIKIKSKKQFKEQFFSFLKYYKNIDNHLLNFWKDHIKKIKPFYENKKSNNDVIISASPEFLLDFVSKQYKFTLIATKMDKHTGKILGENCYGEEKVKRLKKNKISKCKNFYSDSLSDKPVAKLAEKAYIVSGNRIIDMERYKPSLTKRIKMLLFDRDFIVFVMIGLINVFNGVWIAYVYSLFINNPIIAYIFGFITSLTIAYILNSLLNFKQRLSFKKYIKFAINNIPNFIIQVISVVLLIEILGISKIISYIISASIAVPITFLLVKKNVLKNNCCDINIVLFLL